jgi:hypothetical protein
VPAAGLLGGGIFGGGIFGGGDNYHTLNLKEATPHVTNHHSDDEPRITGDVKINLPIDPCAGMRLSRTLTTTM